MRALDDFYEQNHPDFVNYRMKVKGIGNVNYVCFPIVLCVSRLRKFCRRRKTCLRLFNLLARLVFIGAWKYAEFVLDKLALSNLALVSVDIGRQSS